MHVGFLSRFEPQGAAAASLLLVVSLMGAGLVPAAFGDAPASNGTSYSALPDNDPDSGDFLSVAGINLNTLAGVEIRLYLGIPAGRTSFEVGIFDGNTGGHWDSGSDVLNYRLFMDPEKTGTTAMPVVTWTSTGMPDDDWFTQTLAPHADAQAPSGNYFYRLDINWASPTAESLNAFKVRTDGQISIRAGEEFGFIGGPQRIEGFNEEPYDPCVGSGDPNPGETNDPDANSYDGDWNFYFYVPAALTSITFRDGDSDRVDDTDDANTPPPDEGASPGAPADDGTLYGPCAHVAPSIYNIVTDPDGNAYYNFDPSGNVEWENFIIGPSSSNPDVLVSGLLSPGLWEFNVRGMDAHNANYLRASQEIYSNQDPPLTVSPPPTVEPDNAAEVPPGTSVQYAHAVTNNGQTDNFDLTATSSMGWPVTLYNDQNANGVVDVGEPVITGTGSLGPNATFYLVAVLDVPSSASGGDVDTLTITASSTVEWALQDSAVDTTTVQQNLPPEADFTWDPTAPSEGEVIQFTDLSTDDNDDIVSWAWTFGDGGTSGLQNPSHAYGHAGTYSVTLTVTDGEGLADSETKSVAIANVAPDVHLNEPLTYTLTQGSFSTEIPALERAESAASYYDYYSVSAHTGLEVPYESKLFLYRDTTTNEVSLFIIHDIDGDVSYGSCPQNCGSPDAQAKFTFSGVPSGAYVAQSDDPPEMTLAGGTWHWWYNTDGGVVAGLPTDTAWSLTITPDYFIDVNNWIYHYASGTSLALDMSTPVTIAFTPPTEVDVLTIDEGNEIAISGSFDDPSWLDTHTVEWDFGDGTTAGGTFSPGVGWTHHDVDPAFHTYGDNGDFTVTLTVTDDLGATGSDTVEVQVANVAPTLSLGGPYAVDEGSVLSLSATATDPGSDDLTFAWDFGQGDSASVTHYNDGSGPDPFPSPGGTFPFTVTDTQTTVYGDNGVFTITLTVTDDDGGSVTATTTVTVANVAPTATPTPASLAGDENSAFSFVVDATDPGSDDLTFTVDWGEGTVEQVTFYNDGVGPDPFPSPGGTFPFAASAPFSHIYGDNGVFDVLVTVSDDDGGVAALTVVITVANVAPTLDADISATATGNLTLRVAGEKFHDVVLTLYEDGAEVAVATVLRVPGNPDEQAATIEDVTIDLLGGTWSAIVEYTPLDDVINGQVWGADPAWLIFTLPSGEKSKIHHTFNVRHEDTWVWEVTDLAALLVGLPITFSATASDPGSDDLTFTWKWGYLTSDTVTTYYNDGIGPDPFPSPDVNPIAITDTVTHTFAASGTYTITVTVTDDDGGSATLSITITL